MSDGSSNAFSNVATRKHGYVYLTCTPATIISRTEDITASTEISALSTFQGNVVGINLQAKFCCARCHKKQTTFNRETKYHSCLFCGMVQQTFVIGTVVLQGEKDKKTLSTSSSAVAQFGTGAPFICCNGESIEEYFLDGRVFEVQYSDQSAITKCCHISYSEEVQSELLSSW